MQDPNYHTYHMYQTYKNYVIITLLSEVVEFTQSQLTATLTSEKNRQGQDQERGLRFLLLIPQADCVIDCPLTVRGGLLGAVPQPQICKVAPVVLSVNDLLYKIQYWRDVAISGLQFVFLLHTSRVFTTKSCLSHKKNKTDRAVSPKHTKLVFCSAKVFAVTG